MRKCRVCNHELPDERFSVSKRKDKNGLIREYRDTTCMACRRQKYLAKPGKREIHRAGNKSWYQNNPEKAKSQRLKRYGIDFEQYNELRLKQNYCCAVCGTHESKVAQGRAKTPATALHVDHCHDTGVIRGLLCTNCNTILGKCYDSDAILQKAIDYLRKQK